MRVVDLMHSQLVTVSPDDTLRDAVDRMDLYQVSGLPVVDRANQLIGVISEHDIIRELLPAPSENPDSDEYRESLQDIEARVNQVREMKVSDAMSKTLVMVEETDDVLEAAALMLARKVKRLPVTSEGRLTGIISRIDICQAFLEDNM